MVKSEDIFEILIGRAFELPNKREQFATATVNALSVQRSKTMKSHIDYVLLDDKWKDEEQSLQVVLARNYAHNQIRIERNVDQYKAKQQCAHDLIEIQYQQ